MNLDELLTIMRKHHVSLPHEGSGINGRIINQDLSDALGDHFIQEKYKKDPVRRAHCDLRRTILPMKSYRYDKIPEKEKEDLWKDNNNWIAEQKYNGWRLIITYLPNKGIAIWGGNCSDVDFLPKDYTEHLPLKKLNERLSVKNNPLHTRYPFLKYGFMLDCEGLIDTDSLEEAQGISVSSTLEAMMTIFGSLPERALELQKAGARVKFKAFDCILEESEELNHKDLTLSFRKEFLVDRVYALNKIKANVSSAVFGLNCAPFSSTNKKQLLNTLWAQGEEGVILKNKFSPYLSGKRLKEVSVKVKRSMSGEIGDDIDAFIVDYTYSKEWSKLNLIGGFELGVYLNGIDLHVIATVASMPMMIREMLTDTHGKGKEKYIGSIMVVDGQELSHRNTKLMHAKVDFDKSFRKDKSKKDCTLDIGLIEDCKY